MKQLTTKFRRYALAQSVLLSMCTLMGCGLFQEAFGNQDAGSPGRDGPAPDEPVVTVEETPDTVALAGPEVADTLTTEPEETPLDELPSGRLDAYRIALLLPFLANRFDTFDLRFRSISQWSMQYAMGLQLAAERLVEQDVDLTLDIHDTEGDPDRVEELLEEENLERAHLIFGPYRRVTIQRVADFAREREINMVSPYSAASNLTTDNPHYLQARPSMRIHCERLVEHAIASFRPEQIVLVGQNRDIDRSAIAHFQEGYYKAAGSRAVPSLMEYYIDSETADFEEIDVTPFIDTLAADTTVFLVSAWTPDDETFVYSLLREIEVARQFGEEGPQENTVFVYGTPAWTEYERTPLDYFRKLNLHVSSSTFIDHDDAEVLRFKRSFFDRFGLLPTEEAFLGFDLMNYFGEMLVRYGPGFQRALEREPRTGLHTSFDFQRVVPPDSRAEDDPPIQQFENTFVHILKFSDYAFQPVGMAPN